MGRIFIEHLGGERVFSCHCHTPLTNRDELLSTRFTGSTGRAFLFNRVVNVKYSEIQASGLSALSSYFIIVYFFNFGHVLSRLYM